ncbi:tyrosine-type recombinase/integrase [Paradonghicola geojensis]|nr:tyrosine-type recombinase/integrase [Marivivens geojensis]
MGRKPKSKRETLDALKVRQLKEPGKYYDEHGLYLRVTASHPRPRKNWVQRIVINGKQRELGLGSATLVTLAEAREMARNYRKAAREGRDPIAERKRNNNVPTFSEAVDQVYKLHEPSWRNKKHAAQFRSTLEQYVSPFCGMKKISEVTSQDVMNALKPIWLTKTETARRVKQRIGVVMKWAIVQGYRLDDPSNAIEQALPKAARAVKQRKSIHYDKVAECLSAVQGSHAGASTKLALDFLILTAARSGEVRLATWPEINLKRRLWTIPAERMKGKAEHVVPLSDRAVDVLNAARELGKGDLVFPGAKAGRPMSDMTMSKLIKELGFDADVHGFRTSFRVWVQECTDASFEVAEKALAHKTKNKVVAAYARSNLIEKRRELMQQWADHLTQAGGKVVKIGGGHNADEST